MKKNIGTIDRVMRVVFALVIAILMVAGEISGTAVIVLGIFGAMFLLTSLMGFCPLYVPFKFSTLPQQTKDVAS